METESDDVAAEAQRSVELGVLAALGRSKFSYDVVKMAKLRASMDSADYYNEHMSKVPNYSARVRLLDAAVEMISVDNGFVLEFGVARVRTH